MFSQIEDHLEANGVRFLRNEPLSPHTTIQIGGPARLMVFPANEAQLRAVLEIARSTEAESAILGGGANFLADSQGYEGIIVNMRGWRRELTISPDGEMVVDAGADMNQVARQAADQGWCGIDFMAVVPGTVGGAVAINAGTNTGGYVSDRLLWVESMTFGGESKHYTNGELRFGYRTSALLYGREIITRACFQLISCAAIDVPPAQLHENFECLLAERREKFPLDLPNFGSTFRSPGPPHPPAGKLIDELGMKGLQIGNAQISPMHGNFIVNLGGATSEDVLALMQKMHDAVQEKYGVSLRPEVHYLAIRNRQRPSLFI